VLYYRTLSLYYHTALEQEKFYETGKTLISLQESQPHFLRENLSDYIAALSNQTVACGLLQKYSEVQACLEKIRDLQPVTEDDRRKIHRQYFSTFFALCTYTGEFEEGRREMERCLLEAELFDPHDYETGSFYLQFVPICIGLGDFNMALDHLNHWLAQRRTVGREDLQSLARMLSLILHYELGNFLLLDSQLRTSARFLKRKNRLHDLERRFMHGIFEAIKLPDTRGQREVFAKVKNDLQPKAQVPETRALLQTFDLLAWLDAKARGQEFAAVVREKYLREVEAKQL
jgi:tetratricopeptide (TPR) repeat protein